MTKLENKFHKFLSLAEDIFLDDNLHTEMGEVPEIMGILDSTSSLDMQKKAFILATIEATLFPLCEQTDIEEINYNGNIRLN